VHLAELSSQDLQRLREIVRKVHMRYHPTELQTEREADMIIETLLPETAEKLLKRSVDQKR
jgi:hypothetical protein